jgi:hypothetical protein
MAEPMTWGDYFTLRLVTTVVVGAVCFGALLLAALLAWARSALHCSECDRRLVRRDGKLRTYESRHYCPYHDPREQ